MSVVKLSVLTVTVGAVDTTGTLICNTYKKRLVKSSTFWCYININDRTASETTFLLLQVFGK